MQKTIRRGLALILAICLVAALGICASAQTYSHSGEYGNSGYGAQGECKPHEAWVSMGSSSTYALSAEGILRYYNHDDKVTVEETFVAVRNTRFTKGTIHIGASTSEYLIGKHYVNGSLVYTSNITYAF